MSRPVFLPTVVLAVLLSLGGVFSASADALPDIYGKIVGRVLDSASGTPLPGVNVLLAGTTQGAATDLDGNYIILRVKPGTYAVQATFIGFATQTVENVQVNVDQTTRIDFEISEEVFEGQEIVITAERGIVQVDRTTTTAVVNAEQLEALPITSINDAVNLQAGVVDGRFRGGRSGEVSYLVNGVPINNSFTNQASFEVEQNMVANLEVISGVFNAEYGQAQSGIVNIVTKDVPSKWAGSVLGYVGTIASSRELEFVTRLSEPGRSLPASAFGSEFVGYSEATDMVNQADLQVSVGGPLLKERLGIQVSGRYRRDLGTLIMRDLFTPADSSQNLNSGLDETSWVVESRGSGDFQSNDSERLSMNIAINAALTRTIRLDYNVFLQTGHFNPYSHGSKYVPTGLNTGYSGSQTHIASFRYTIGAKSFGNVSYSLLRDKFDQYLYDCNIVDDPSTQFNDKLLDCGDDRYESSRLSGLTGANAFAVGGNDLYTNDNLTKTHTFLADFSSQLNNVHLMKGGVMTRFHSLKNRGYGIERSARTRFRSAVSPDLFSDNSLDASPREFAAYVQDKMEFTGLIVNAGLRFDYFDPNYDVPVVWGQAESDSALVQDANGDPTEIYNRRAADIATQLSPRIGIAFPISSTGVMRFSAGMFFQTPPLSLLFTNPEFEVNPASTNVQFGNAELRPERTLQFEVGLQQGLTDNIGLELSIFSKDVRNLTGQDVERTPQGDFVVHWINRDYGTVRGVTFSLFDTPGGILSWTLDYTLQFAEGTSSDVNEAFNRQQSGLEPILSLVRLNWDRRHVLNNTITLKPIDGLDITLLQRLRSGEPYTTTRDFVRSTQPNNADRPFQYWADLRIYYRPPVIKDDVQVFLQVENIFDNEAQFAVYGTTGSAFESLEKELFRQSSTRVGGLNSLDEFFQRPEWLLGPRKVSLGLNYRF